MPMQLPVPIPIPIPTSIHPRILEPSPSVALGPLLYGLLVVDFWGWWLAARTNLAACSIVRVSYLDGPRSVKYANECLEKVKGFILSSIRRLWRQCSQNKAYSLSVVIPCTYCLFVIVCLSVFEQDGDEIPSRRLEREKMRSLPELVL